MKEYLTANRVSFADCVEKSDLVRRVQETIEKKQHESTMNPQQQVRTCDCMQTGAHTHGAAEASGEQAKKAPRATRENGAIVRHIPVGPLQCNMTIIADPVTKEAMLIDPGGDAEVSQHQTTITSSG